MAFEGGGLDIESVFVAVGDVATEQHFGTFFLTNREVRFDLFVLLRTGLRTNHGGFVEGVALNDLRRAFFNQGHEIIVNVFMNQRA